MGQVIAGNESVVWIAPAVESASGWEMMDHEGHDETDESDEGYIPCPYCGQTMLEDAEYCHHCDRWLTDESPASPSRPWWVIAVVVVLIAALMFSLV